LTPAGKANKQLDSRRRGATKSLLDASRQHASPHQSKTQSGFYTQPSQWKSVAERAFEKLALPQEAIIDFIEARSQVRTPNRFEGRVGSKLGLGSMLGTEQKPGYAGLSATKVTAPSVDRFVSPRAVSRKNVKS